MKYVLYSSDYVTKILEKKGFNFEYRITVDASEINNDVKSVYYLKNNYNGEKIIIPSFISDDINSDEIYNYMISIGFDCNNILFIPIEMIYGDEKIDVDKFYKYDDVTYLDYIEININDHCNLNCKGCSHFAPLAPASFKNFDTFSKDIKRLKQLIPHIFKIRIMGGEPLLNPELKRYVEIIKEVYPYSDLRIVTNGLLLKNMSDELLEFVKINDIMLDISVYPPLFNVIDEIVQKLKNKHVKLFLEHISMFKPILLDSKEKYPFKTLQNCNCINLENGFISSCPLQTTIKYYNEHFENKYNYKTNKINIYDDSITGAEIKKRLKEPFELCDYCAHYRDDLPFFEWSQSLANINSDDWIYKKGK